MHNFFKKLFFTFLTTVLLTVGISFFSTSFAFTTNECKGIVYNIYRYKWELSDVEAKARVDMIDWNTVPDWLDGHNDFKMLVYMESIPRIDVFWWNDTVKPYYYGGTIYRVKTRLKLVLQKNLPSIQYWDSANQVDTGQGYFNTNWFYTQAPLYNSSSASTPTYNAGFSNISWIESDNSYFNPVRFEPAPTSTLVDLLTFEDVPVYPYALGGISLGDFIDPNNECLFVEDDLKIYYWYSGDLLPWSLMHREFYDSNGDSTGKIYNSNRFLDISPNASFTDYTLRLKSAFTYYNMLYVYKIGYVTEWIEGATVNYIFIPFYLSDEYTVFENGSINGHASVRDWNAYFRQFDSNGQIINDNKNTDDIISTITSGDSFIIDTIINAVGTLPSGDSGDSGSGLLGGIFTGLKRLFIPEDGFFQRYFNELNSWFSNHLGFLYFPFEFIVNLFERIISLDFSNPVLNIGSFNFPFKGDIVEVIPHYTYDFNDLLEDESFSSMYNIYLIIIDGIIIGWFIYLLWKKYNSFTKGD